MKRIAFIIFYIVLIIIGISVIIGLFIHEKRPASSPTASADSVAQVMLQAINEEAWDSTRFVRWDFLGMHEYLWDKERQYVMIDWGKNRVFLHTATVRGAAMRNGKLLKGGKAEKLIEQGWTFFCNDSFWLNAPAKAFDPGTERSLITLEDGRQALLVAYTSGGVTPGDAYAWILDDKGLPQSWKMWVSILPIGGLEVSWEDWIRLNGGARIATTHGIGPFTMEISGTRAAFSLKDLGYEEDPFAVLDEKIKNLK